ncbi:uncharacterized protein LOC141529811 [Cotesia typhae]|uniref:uncharacterized protein LOC141529811 n=1 Tax=Cotesia typhae TaxID=2053667 RepID=UPI003D69F030
MFLSINEILDHLGSTPKSRNFIEGEQVVNSNHLVYTGILNENSEQYKLLSYCIQSSKNRDDPHEINTVITKTGKIVSSICSCTAGLSERCKHSAAVLLFCTRNDLTSLKIETSTDRKCLWSAPRDSCLEQYNAKPLSEHSCFKIKNNHLELDKDVKKLIKEKLYSKHLKSSLSEHAAGRHTPLLHTVETLPPEYLRQIECLISHLSSSSILSTISDQTFRPLRECCQKTYEQLIGDPFHICKETKKFYSVWQNERKFRITGSRCYELYTYRKNLKPDWQKKSLKYFYPSTISNAAINHGLKFESDARKAYEKYAGVNVFQCGLVVPENNPWLGYSPDGVIFEYDKPVKLIEIKCPHEGKSLSMDDIISNIQKTPEDNNNLTLKKNHKYYGQVQLGMGILNIEKTDFILFSSHDKSMKIISVDYDKKFVKDLFISLKFIFFNQMLHYACESKQHN